MESMWYYRSDPCSGLMTHEGIKLFLFSINTNHIENIQQICVIFIKRKWFPLSGPEDFNTPYVGRCETLFHIFSNLAYRIYIEYFCIWRVSSTCMSVCRYIDLSTGSWQLHCLLSDTRVKVMIFPPTFHHWERAYITQAMSS